jgi:hypothetical protein
MDSQFTGRNMFILLLVLVLLGLAYSVMMAPDQRSTTQKVGDAIHELPNGVDKAANELKDDRTPGQKLGDAVRNAGDKIKENTGPNN